MSKQEMTFQTGNIEVNFTQVYGQQFGRLQVLQNQGACGWQQIFPPIRCFVSEVKYLAKLNQGNLEKALEDMLEN